MKKLFGVLKIRKEERLFFTIALFIFIGMNILFIHAHYPAFTQANNGHIGAYALFGDKLDLSGYDPYTYMTITQFTTRYILNRHPLITIFLYPLYLLNHWIMVSFNFNAAMFIIAFFIILASSYSAIFMFRFLHDIMKLKRSDACWLTALLFSFGAIMTSSVSPDLFMLSMFMLTLALYVFSRAIINNQEVQWYKTAILYIITAGITITNGIKILLGMLFVNGKRTFSHKNLILSFIIPTLIILVVGFAEYKKMYLPRIENDQKINLNKQKENPELSAKIDSICTVKREAINGKSHADIPYIELINADADRWNCSVEWFFGESIQIHQDYSLMDIYKGRPMIVRYRHWWNYAIEGLIVLTFFAGIWIGRRNKIVQMLASWFAIDVIIHIVLGFGLNEANINGCHWMFFIPVALSSMYTFKNGLLSHYLRALVPMLTIYLWIYNGTLLVSHLI